MRALACALILTVALSAAPASAQGYGSYEPLGARNVLGYSEDECARMLTNAYEPPPVPNDVLGEQAVYCYESAGAVGVSQQDGSSGTPDTQYASEAPPSDGDTRGLADDPAPDAISTGSLNGESEPGTNEASQPASKGSSEAAVSGDGEDSLPATGGAPLIVLGAGALLLLVGGFALHVTGRQR